MTPRERLHSFLLRARNLTGYRTQTASLIALGAFAVHQLRYLLAAPSLRDLPLTASDLVAHVLPLLAGLLLTGLIARIVSSRIGGSGIAADRRWRATTYAIGIIVVFCSQQVLEGALIAGHVGGLAAIFSSGGWAALPLAIVIGAIAAIVDRGIAEIELRLGRPGRPASRRADTSERRKDQLAFPHLLTPLAFGIASRPPPVYA